ncbi:MAG: PilZ domain-containing protein [Deltaproteobacteria bacterium]|nr:PilZ domain-containing protein [Deltaproteobacteria bacterium]
MRKKEIDKRRHLRGPLKVEIKAGMSNAAGIIYFFTKNLSKGGAFLISDFLFEQGQELTMSFQLPGDNRVILAVGRVKWVNDKDKIDDVYHEPGMGIEFIKISPADERRIDEFLRTYTCRT